MRFFCAFQQERGGEEDNFAKKKKKKKETNHRHVFNSSSIYQNVPLEIPGRGGGGVWGPPPEKI